jgi:transglutaminase/protease-like cytokinesis protein 3
VCAGYAALLHELGEVTGDEIAYVTGTSDLSRHAWNVAATGRGYEPIDVTWDARSNLGHTYSAEWLFMSAREFTRTHVADDPAWDLGATRYALPVAAKEESAAARAIEQMVRRR